MTYKQITQVYDTTLNNLYVLEDVLGYKCPEVTECIKLLREVNIVDGANK